MSDLRPYDPSVSQYPLPMSAKRAQFEARNARRQRLVLPKGHPYRRVPVWMPYSVAKALTRIIG